MRIVNLTQHQAGIEQLDAGVFELHHQMKEEVKRLLTFDSLPTREDIERAAQALAWAADASGADAAMIGGAPFLMAALEERLKALNIKPLYAFSQRESVEETQPDGSTRKVNIFRHLGFVGV